MNVVFGKNNLKLIGLVLQYQFRSSTILISCHFCKVLIQHTHKPLIGLKLFLCCILNLSESLDIGLHNFIRGELKQTRLRLFDENWWVVIKMYILTRLFSTGTSTWWTICGRPRLFTTMFWTFIYNHIYLLSMPWLKIWIAILIIFYPNFSLELIDISFSFFINVLIDFCWLFDYDRYYVTCLRQLLSKLKPLRLNYFMISPFWS